MPKFKACCHRVLPNHTIFCCAGETDCSSVHLKLHSAKVCEIHPVLELKAVCRPVARIFCGGGGGGAYLKNRDPIF